MSRREQLSGIWLMSMTLLSFCSYTVFYVAKMLPKIYSVAYLVLAILQSVALIVYMWGPEKLKFGLSKVAYRLLCATSLLVIPTFALLFMGLVSQYHVEIPESIDAATMPVEEILPGNETVVYNTGSAYVFFPEYSEICLVCEDRPSKLDDTITWCSGAAFQHDISLGYSPDNIEGDYAASGAFHDSPYYQEGFAALVFAEGRYSFEFENPSEAIKEAASAGGSGFMQYGLIKDGEDVGFGVHKARCYRAVAELNGNLCIVDSARMTYFEAFMQELHRLGVTNAIYMDMGAGWNYSWFRSARDEVMTLFGLPVPWSHNWIVFKK